MRGKRLRVPGKGLPSDPPGDLYIELRIVAPPAGGLRAGAAMGFLFVGAGSVTGGKGGRAGAGGKILL